MKKQDKLKSMSELIEEKLRDRFSKYSTEQSYKLIDYLSEWTAHLPINRPIIKLIEERLLNKFNSKSRKHGQEELHYYTILTFRYYFTPEDLMKNLLTGEEWNKIYLFIKRRSSSENLSIRTTIEDCISNNKAGN